MNAKFFDGLYEGDSPNGVKLGMGLTGGDFWCRVGGCRNLYRGEGPFDVDFERLVAVGDIDAGQIVSRAGHEAGAVYYYVLRDVNGCGDELQSNVMVRAAFDGEGNWIEPGCNDVFDIWAGQIPGPRVRLVWYYSRADEQVECERFNVYADNGSGEIDFENASGSVSYRGKGLYSYESGVLSEGTYRFCVRCESVTGIENGLAGMVRIGVTECVPAEAGTLSVGVV